MELENFVTITADRYAELVSAEQEAKRMKTFMHNRCKRYSGIKYEELLTFTEFFPVREEDCDA